MSEDVKPREWWIETESIKENRALEIKDGKVFIEYGGRPLAKPIHVIEKSAYDKLAADFESQGEVVWARVEDLEAKLQAERKRADHYRQALERIANGRAWVNCNPDMVVEFARTALEGK